MRNVFVFGELKSVRLPKKVTGSHRAAGEASKNCAKLVTRNVAFEATEREVRGVFKMGDAEWTRNQT